MGPRTVHQGLIKISLTMTGIEKRFLGRPVCSLLNRRTEISRLPKTVFRTSRDWVGNKRRGTEKVNIAIPCHQHEGHNCDVKIDN